VKAKGNDVIFELCKLLSCFLVSKLQRKLLTNLITSFLLYLIKKNPLKYVSFEVNYMKVATLNEDKVAQ